MPPTKWGTLLQALRNFADDSHLPESEKSKATYWWHRYWKKCVKSTDWQITEEALRTSRTNLPENHSRVRRLSRFAPVDSFVTLVSAFTEELNIPFNIRSDDGHPNLASRRRRPAADKQAARYLLLSEALEAYALEKAERRQKLGTRLPEEWWDFARNLLNEQVCFGGKA